MWEHAMEARPMLYRHLLSAELSSSAECQAVTPPAQWSESITKDALTTAKQLFHSVYPGGGMHHVTDAGGKPASMPIYRTVECVGGPIRNSLRSSPSTRRCFDSQLSMTPSRLGRLTRTTSTMLQPPRRREALRTVSSRPGRLRLDSSSTRAPRSTP